MPAFETQRSRPELERYAAWTHESESPSPSSLPIGLWHGQLDNPSYPFAYALGQQEFHRLRAERERAGEASQSLRGRHDAIMGFGSEPHALIRDDVLALAACAR